MKLALPIGIASIALAVTAVVVTSFERPSPDSVQHGYRGTGMVQVYNPRALEATVAANQVPVGLPRVPAVGPKASQVYQNVQVLGDLSVGEFTRLMVGITQWVSPEQGCNYCHVGNNFAAEDLYTKAVSRRMIQMTQHINQEWKSHVEETGVTCYTCHRGNPVPANAWARDTGPARATGMTADSAGQNIGGKPAVGHASLPYDAFTPFFENANEIRVGGTQALPTDNTQSIKSAEWTYGLMMHFSTALGVNCTFCHNSRNFADWGQASPNRVNAWYGIRLVRDVNNNYITPLQPLWAANPAGPPGGPAVARLGPHGDALKVNCTTCHQGAYQPLLGVSMAQEYPELTRVSGTAAR